MHKSKLCKGSLSYDHLFFKQELQLLDLQFLLKKQVVVVPRRLLYSLEISFSPFSVWEWGKGCQAKYCLLKLLVFFRAEWLEGKKFQESMVSCLHSAHEPPSPGLRYNPQYIWYVEEQFTFLQYIPLISLLCKGEKGKKPHKSSAVQVLTVMAITWLRDNAKVVNGPGPEKSYFFSNVMLNGGWANGW